MGSLLEYSDAVKLVREYGIEAPESRYVSSAEDAVDFSRGRSIALKVISNKAMHKSKSGVVMVNLTGRDEIVDAFNHLKSRAVRGRLSPYRILAQVMAEPGTEIIIGGSTDAQFGKLVLVGMGGIYVEVFKDFAMRVCPINEYDAKSMLNELRSRSVIAPDRDTERMVVELLLRTSKLLTENERISELDLNPIIIRRGGYSAVDIRVLV